MLSQLYSSVSPTSQQASCIHRVILQGVFERSSVVDFLHKQCELKCKEAGLPQHFPLHRNASWCPVL